MEDAARVYQLVSTTGEEAFNDTIGTFKSAGLGHRRLADIFGAAADELPTDDPRHASCQMISAYYHGLPQRITPFSVPAHLPDFPFPV